MPHLDQSLAFLEQLELPRTARIIDVGGGASTLVDDLLARGYERPTVLDLAAPALAAAQARLGAAANAVDWIAADITTAALPPATFDLWHDRAVFHFLTTAVARAAYVARLRHALRPGGAVILATFAADGPLKCSGLPVARYDAAAQRAALGAGFDRLADVHCLHHTPWGSTQAFQYGLFRFAG
ncbi:MAG: methyltransferase domain-containing protein [Myxococcales bacterium]|nr:methyltransferase domain-containing protein [Myxococcales bacterium]